MIDVRIDYGELRLTMDGHAHAERNENDHDLVCCAASILVQTLIRSCSVCYGLRVEGEAASGHADVRISVEQKVGNSAAIHRFQMAVDGLDMLQKTYPESIRIVYQ